MRKGTSIRLCSTHSQCASIRKKNRDEGEQLCRAAASLTCVAAAIVQRVFVCRAPATFATLYCREGAPKTLAERKVVNRLVFAGGRNKICECYRPLSIGRLVSRWLAQLLPIFCYSQNPTVANTHTMADAANSQS